MRISRFETMAALAAAAGIAGCSVTVEKNLQYRPAAGTAATQPAGGNDGQARAGRNSRAQDGHVNIYAIWRSETDAENTTKNALRAAFEAAVTGQGTAEQSGDTDSGGGADQ